MDKRIPFSVFEDIADRYPDAIAVEAPDATLTYAELDCAGNSIANTLIGNGYTPGSIATVFIPNSAAYIASIIGIQKACGVFMPADPNAPHDRQIKMFAKSEPSAVIVDAERLPSFRQFMEQSGITPGLLIVVSPCGTLSVHRNDGSDDSGTEPNRTRPGILPDPDDDLYIMFTSGTTGTPKAVLGRQKGLAHFIAWERAEFGFDETLNASNLAPTTFDVSLRDIFVPLCSGGTVSVPAENIRTSPGLLLDWIVSQKINLVHIVPSIFRLLLDELEKRPDPPALLAHMRYFMLAGEAVYGRDVIRFRTIAGGTVGLVNLYGPTETTLAKLFCRLDFTPENPARIMPLGNPISNTAVIIITNNRLAEIGEIGEIYIKTPFRSKGYFRDPELTAAVFVANPLTGDSGDIIYRTGDMGRYLPDRSVEFAGRLDRQVKVNGVRVELSEVDEAVTAAPGIKHALVMPYTRDNGETSLICYYTEESHVDTVRMREHLATNLYSAMIPSFYVRMDAFPLGINGKIDRRALPKPDEIIYEDSDYIAPETDIEKRLAALWSEVLGIRKIGVTTSFSALGGGSMQAIRCVGSISRAFGIDVSIRDFFAADSIRALAKTIEASHGAKQDAAIPRQPERPDYPSTHSQKRLWMLQTMIPGFTAFNIAGCYRVNGGFDSNAFEHAIGTVIERHDILRTVFVERNGELRQRVLPPSVFHLDHPGASGSQISAVDIADEYARTVFDLEHGPLLRAGVFEDASGTLLVFVIHHIICDAWSLDIILRETLMEYNSIIAHSQSSVHSPALQYRDFATWQNSRLTSGELEKQRLFWLEYLKDGVPRLDMPVDRPRPSRRSYRGAVHSYVFPEDMTTKVRDFAASNGTTLFAVLLAGLRILLFRYSGQNDIVVNAPVTLRGRPELETILGDFTNTVLLRCSIDDDMSFSFMVNEAAREIEHAMQNRDYPFDLLVEALAVKGDLSRAPVSDVGITLVEDFNDGTPETGLKLEPFELNEGISKYDMVFHFSLSSEGLTLALEYDTAIFRKGRIMRMAKNLSSLFNHAVSRPETSVSELNILDPAEQSKIDRFQLPNPAGYEDSTIHGAFRRIVKEHHGSCALVLEDGSEMSFSELDRNSDRIANMLSEKGYGKVSRIAVYMHRSPNIPITILGILKAGCVYVPLAEDLPLTRIAHIVADSEACAVFVDDDLAASLPAGITKLNIADAAGYPDTPCLVEVMPTDEAYIIYTSGSTGKPKGVLLPHRGLVNRARDLKERAGISSRDRFTQFASLSFDASIYEMFCSLLNGASIAVVTRDTIIDTEAFIEFIEKRGITFTLLPPTYVRRLERKKLPGLRVLKTAGEAADPVFSIHYAHEHLCLNGYGPTEDSVCSTIFTVDPNRDYPLGIPIGTPVGDTEILVLDRNMHRVPIGVPGQLCVSDNGLAIGYLNLPDATAQSFVTHPFDSPKRMYLTGDLACWNDDGNLLFLGRIDNQVKIGGHRIEPGEIEHVLQEIDGIDIACVVPVGEPNDMRLAAYYSGGTDENHLRGTLTESLPSYMIPHFIIRMDSLPMTLSGKIDRKKLSSMAVEERQHTEIHEAATEAEAELLSIIRDVLGTQSIGIDTNFFSAGGDSIRAIQVCSRLRGLGWALSAGDFFVMPVIRDLAAAMSRSMTAVSTEPVSGPVKTTPILEWFLKTVHIHPEHFNQAVMLKSGEDFDIPALKTSLETVWRHHDALRMVLVDGVFTILPDDTSFSIEIVDLDSSNDPEALMRETAEKAQTGFDLSKGPLFSGILFKRSGGDRLLLTAHHCVIDAVSWGILVHDIETAYHQAIRGIPIELPGKSHSYRDWAEALNGIILSGGFDGELPYWQALADTACDTIAAHDSRDSTMASLTTYIEGVSATGLLDEGGTQETLARMLAGLAVALNEWKNMTTVRVMLEGHGRNSAETGLDISRTVGWFTVSWPFNLHCSGEVQTAFDTIHQSLKDIPGGGAGYGALRYIGRHEEIAVETDISFNYLGRLEFAASAFSIADEPVGETVHPGNRLGYALEFLLSVSGDRLEIHLTFDTGRVAEKDAELLLDTYRSALVTAMECHASDFDYTDFGEGGIDGFLDSL